MTEVRKYELEFSDLEMGHPELGFTSREDCRDPDEEDAEYARFLKRGGIDVVSVVDGVARVRVELPFKGHVIQGPPR